MSRSSLSKCFLLPLFLCLGAANVPAQQAEMVPPPIPSVLPSPPPDPDTLPPPPALNWESLTPPPPEDELGPPPAVLVPPPHVEVPLAPPPPPVVETPVPGLPNPNQQELVQPDVEVWRQQSELPQVPTRQLNRLAQAYMTGTEPVWLRVQFDPQAAGKSVYVRPGRGITVSLSASVLTVSPSGECLLLAQLAEGVNRSHIIFYCEGVRTALPLVRATLATVIGAEEESGGGH